MPMKYVIFCPNHFQFQIVYEESASVSFSLICRSIYLFDWGAPVGAITAMRSTIACIDCCRGVWTWGFTLQLLGGHD
jgi:hypothetical protein